MLLLCLSRFIPGKVGRVIRRMLLVAMSVVALYFITWLVILKGIKIEAIDQMADTHYVYLTFSINNDSFHEVEVKDMNIRNTSGALVKRKLQDLPVIVPRYSDKQIRMVFALDHFKSIEVDLKTLLNSYKAKSDLV